MKKKVLYTDFEDAGSIIENLMSSRDLKKAITRNNLYKFWGKVAGAKFAEKSKPYGMVGGGTMIIACANSAVAQELQLRKIQLLEQLQPYLKSLQMNVKDLKFDCKKWAPEE